MVVQAWTSPALGFPSCIPSGATVQDTGGFFFFLSLVSSAGLLGLQGLEQEQGNTLAAHENNHHIHRLDCSQWFTSL